MTQYLRDLSFKVFSESSATALEEAVDAFLEEGGDLTDQARIVSWDYQVDGGTHNLTLIYAE